MQKRLSVGLATAGLLVLLTLAAKVTMAQAVTGTLLGTVLDSTGAAIPGAIVTLTNEGTNVTSKTSSSQQGFYTFPNVGPGQYTVVADAKGFKKLVHNITWCWWNRIPAST